MVDDIFTEGFMSRFDDKKPTEDTSVQEAQTGYNVGVFTCPEGFVKNDKGECIEKVKENGVVETDASVAPEINTASISDPGSSVSTDPSICHSQVSFLSKTMHFG